jgi:hypothetical protein
MLDKAAPLGFSLKVHACHDGPIGFQGGWL